MPSPPKRIFDGDAQFRRGVHSVNPLDLVQGFYARSVNILNRGGVLQTRPGYRWLATLPKGKLQGFTVFRPFDSEPQLLVVVGGFVYRSYYPYEKFTKVEGIFFSERVERVYFAHTVRVLKRNEDTSLTFITPIVTLMIQDGINAPAYYDGTDFLHLKGALTTPRGTVMAWSGDRLWVAQGSRIYVSDIGNPLSFFEEIYNTLGARQFFTVNGDVTGMAETPGSASPQLLVFTQSQTVAFQSNVRERSTWPTLPNFQTKLFDVGAVSHRSIVAQHGLLYWMTSFGLVSFDSAVLSLHSSELGFKDNEMAWSKARMNGYMASICGASFENYLIMSVPHESYYNPHTWVLDFTVRDTINEHEPKAWASVWAGTRPVEWVSVAILGVPRVFHASVDADGQNRIWEAFTSERRDEFCDIDWSIETRSYNAGNIFQKEMRFAELAFSDLQGAVDLSVKWAGANKGRWYEIANFRAWANEGNIFYDKPVPDPVFGLKKQVRLFRTLDVRNVPIVPPDGCAVESRALESQDSGFQLCISGNGPCALNTVRLFLDEVTDDHLADCPKSEDSGNFVRMSGCASHDLAELATMCASCGGYSGTVTVKAEYAGYEITVTKTAESCLSQAAADKIAEQQAWAEANLFLRREAPKFVVGEIPTPEPGPEPEPGYDPRLDFSDGRNSQYVPLVF
jgi:hypothetical protein